MAVLYMFKTVINSDTRKDDQAGQSWGIKVNNRNLGIIRTANGPIAFRASLSPGNPSQYWTIGTTEALRSKRRI